MFEDIIHEISETYRAESKKGFLRDIAGQIEDDENISELLTKTGGAVRRLVVTFDRKRNDRRFSYSHADLLLVVLDRISGGTGIRKPLSQVRVVQSKWNRSQLLRIIRYFSRNNREIRFRRILILKYPDPVVGHRLDPAVYLR